TSVNDYLLARLQPFVDKPAVAVPVADHDRTGLRLSALPPNPDKVALAPLLHRSLRHKDRIRPERPVHARFHILVRPECPVGVIECNANQKSTGLSVVERR